MEKSKSSDLKRRALAILNRQKLYDPALFLSPKRLDIAAKTIFARAYIEKNTSDWPEHVYKEHIRSFNNFYENEPLKTTYDDFKQSFISTIKSTPDNSWKHHAPVPIDGSYLINGAHRVAASLVLGDKVNGKVPETLRSDVYDYNFFRSDRGSIYRIDEDVLDYMTVEYVSQKKSDVFVAIIFPAAGGYREEAYQHLLSLGEIVNVKSFKHDEFLGAQVIKQIYVNSHNDAWNCGIDFKGAEHKASFCFDGTDDLQVYIIEANLDETTRIKEKQYLRSLWDKEKHSIHITDTMDEANRIVRMFFNANSRKFLKIDRKQEFLSQNMYDLFNQYTEQVPSSHLEREKIAIEGSAVFDLMNIRVGKDIDYISRGEVAKFNSSEIERHNEDENIYHSSTIDDVLTNPKYYFYYKGFKFIDLSELYSYKKARAKNGDQKDINDLNLISGFLNKHPMYKTLNNITPSEDADFPTVSVIIPVYNTDESLLKTCLDCIRRQSYRSVEVVIVNDGSNKPTARFLESYVKKNHNWMLINQENKGLSAARNAGFKRATGKYVQFLDSDDYFDQDLLEKAVKKAEESSADVVIENFLVEDYQTGIKSVSLKSQLFPCNETFKLSDIKSSKFETIPFNVWSKLFKREFILQHGITHDEGLRRSEDVLFSYSALLVAERIALLLEPFITYRENLPVSNTKTNDMHPIDSVIAWQKLYHKLKDIGVYSAYRLDFESALLASIHWHYLHLKTRLGKKLLSNASYDLFEEINLKTYDIRRATLELGVSHSYVLSMMDELQDRVDYLVAENKNLYIQVNNLSYPSIKQSGRKFAGSVKRKIKRRLS